MSTSARIVGVGGYVPPQVVTNHDLAQRLDTSDEWIRTRTGIAQRHIVEPGVSTSDLAVVAGEKALANADIRNDIDLLVLATTTPDQPCPATGPAVAAALGLGTIAAYDIAAVCSGFIYALSAAAAAIRADQARCALVIAAETFSTLLDPSDRTTTPIFGDGAAAVVVERCQAGDPGEILHFDLGSDGSQSDLIAVPGGGAKERTSADPSATFAPHFQMQGQQVFRAAVTRMAEASRRALTRTGWSADDVDWLVGHQANARIIAAIGDSLGIASANAIVNLDHVGNTSAASIPLALADAASQQRFNPSDRLLLTAFGGGTTWGAVTLTWPALAPVIPIDQPAERDTVVARRHSA